jgi:phenylalanyl-tRNA synthetase alpha chain
VTAGYRFKKKKNSAPAPTGGEEIVYEDPRETDVLEKLQTRTDFDALRLKRLLALSDLTRKQNSPVKLVIDRILTLPLFKGFDIAQIPETIEAHDAFDLFDFSADHPSRRETDTYFISPDRILRTHTTSMWLYYLTDPDIRKKFDERGWIGELCYGKVYRKDEIDRKHFPVFHQIDGLYLVKRSEKMIGLKDLQEVLSEIVKSVFGPDIEYRFLEDTFPFTDPSTQIEIKFPALSESSGKGDDWLEVVGAGIVRKSTLEHLGIDPREYNGWAFGFGVERLAMQKMDIPDIRVLWSDDKRITGQFTSINSRYKEVSKYPSVLRDISFIVRKDVVPNRFYDIVRELGGDLVEEVRLTDSYENDTKLGADKKSYTFRIIYRSFERTLTNEEINEVHRKIEKLTEQDLQAVIR